MSRCGSPSTGDRFIPNRGPSCKLDFEISNYQVTSEKTPPRSPSRPPSSSSSSSLNGPLSPASSPKNAKEIYREVLEKNLFREASKKTQSKVLSFSSSSPAGSPVFSRHSASESENGCDSPSRSGTSTTSSTTTSSSSSSYAFSPDSPTRITPRNKSLNVMYSKMVETNASRKLRSISTEHTQWLDVPNFLDNFYLNLLDWSSDDVISIAAGKSVYLYHASKKRAAQLCKAQGSGNYPTSLQWSQDASTLAIGNNNAQVEIWDPSAGSIIRTVAGHHTQRVGALAWNGPVLTTGSKDSLIFNYDLRQERALVSVYHNHVQDICGLKWSPNGTYLASGGNDNLLNIWDIRSGRPMFTFDQHRAAVKAIAWCPWQSGLLVSGGGTADKCLRFWNIQSGLASTSLQQATSNQGTPLETNPAGIGGSLLGAIPPSVMTQSSPLLNTVDTESQICAVLWSPHSRELVSSHGYSRYHLCVWRYDTMEKLVDLVGHTSRVLQLALSPDGETVCSVGDESLRLWKIFEKPKQDEDDSCSFRRSAGRPLVSRASDALPRNSPVSKTPISQVYRSPVGLIR